MQAHFCRLQIFGTVVYREELRQIFPLLLRVPDKWIVSLRIGCWNTRWTDPVKNQNDRFSPALFFLFKWIYVNNVSNGTSDAFFHTPKTGRPLFLCSARVFGSQDERNEMHRPKKTLFGTARTIVLHEGYQGLYRGFSMNMVRAIPSCSATFLTYELLTVKLLDLDF